MCVLFLHFSEHHGRTCGDIEFQPLFTHFLVHGVVVGEMADAVVRQSKTSESRRVGVQHHVICSRRNQQSAVMKIAELYGIEHKYTAAIGDYFNDYDMLKTVGLPACCGQAPKAMHEIAKFHACHCNKGAVADLLEYIMNDYKD